MLQSIEYIVCATTLREAHVTVHSHCQCGAVHVSLVGNEHLAQIECLASVLQNLALEEAES